MADLTVARIRNALKLINRLPDSDPIRMQYMLDVDWLLNALDEATHQMSVAQQQRAHLFCELEFLRDFTDQDIGSGDPTEQIEQLRVRARARMEKVAAMNIPSRR